MLLKNVHLQSLRAYVFMNISIFCRLLTFVYWRGLNIFSQDIITWGMVIVIVEFSFETFLSYSKIQKVYRETLSPSLLHPYFPQSRKLHSVILCGNSSWSSESLFVSYIVVCSQVLNQKDSRVILVPIFYAFNASIMSWLHVHCVAFRKKSHHRNNHVATCPFTNIEQNLSNGFTYFPLIVPCFWWKNFCCHVKDRLLRFQRFKRNIVKDLTVKTIFPLKLFWY